MNIDKLCRDALLYLKSIAGVIPDRGVIAGGALGNLIWEMVSGNKAIINDIDLFLLDSINESKGNVFYRDSVKAYNIDYNGLSESIITKDYYRINRTENEGLYNKIYYSGTSDDPELVIKSFDINCTQIGYDILTDKVFWTSSFENFLKSGELKITNLGSPNHTAIRLYKKKDELNAKLNPIEVEMCAYANKHLNISRKIFSTKYNKTYLKYQDELNENFSLIILEDLSKNLKLEKGIDVELYTFLSKDNFISLTPEDCNQVYSNIDLLFYVRNIKEDPIKRNIWLKIKQLYRSEDYLDIIPNEFELGLLTTLIYILPRAVINLEGMKVSQQLSIINKLTTRFSEDLSVAFALIEKNKFKLDDLISDDDALLLELSVRKEIVNKDYSVIESLYKGNMELNKPETVGLDISSSINFEW